METQPIIVKKIKKGGHGHHGGAWKVAFADFVTAMMAFFLLLWLMGSTTQEEKAAIADYFQNPSAIQGPGGASSSMIKHGSVDAEMATHKISEGDPAKVKVVERDAGQDKERLETLKADLEKAIEQSQALKPFKDQLLLDITAEGLRIQIIDKENRPMFASGSSHMKSYASNILLEIAKIINQVPNKISLTGHTDATRYSSLRGYTNWELSSERANASRRALVLGGLDEDKIAKVVGLSSTVLFDKEHPKSPINRRISLIVMNKQAEEALLHKDEKMVESSGEAAKVLSPQRNQTSNKNGSPKSLPGPREKSQSSPILLPMKKNP